jgi:hypothetical protein
MDIKKGSENQDGETKTGLTYLRYFSVVEYSERGFEIPFSLKA